MVPEESVATFFGDPAAGPGKSAAPTKAAGASTAAAQPRAAGPSSLTPEQLALIAEACNKSGVVWLKPANEQRFHVAWHVWHDGAVTVVYGVDEQMLPRLEGRVEVAVRSKDNGSRLVTFVAQGEALAAGTPAWDAAADALSASRLNAVDTTEQRERWAAGTVITRLLPVSMISSGAGTTDTPSGSSQPPGNPGTTMTWRPYHVGGRKLRRGNKPYR